MIIWQVSARITDIDFELFNSFFTDKEKARSVYTQGSAMTEDDPLIRWSIDINTLNPTEEQIADMMNLSHLFEEVAESHE